MFKVVKNPFRHGSQNLTKSWVKQYAKRIILFYPFSTPEKKLDKYFLKYFNISLRKICLILLDAAIIDMSVDNDLIISFYDTKLDSLARLISFGNEILPRSDILLLAFSPKIGYN